MELSIVCGAWVVAVGGNFCVALHAATILVLLQNGANVNAVFQLFIAAVLRRVML